MDNKDNFDFYAYLQSISSEIETNDDYNIDIILKKIIFYSSCEIASLFMDDIFILSKTKFKSFDDNKKYMIATILLASLFHYSALVFFVLLFVDPVKELRLLYIALLFGTYGLFFSGFDIKIIFPYLSYLTFLEYNLSDYSMSTAEVYGTLNGPQILRITTCLLFWAFSSRLKDFNPYAIIYLKVFIKISL